MTVIFYHFVKSMSTVVFYNISIPFGFNYAVIYTIISIKSTYDPLVKRSEIWVPLKTTLKRENEIGASDTRKADEGGLVCRSAPLSRKLDTSPLPGRPRLVRRLDAVDDAHSSFSLKMGF